LEPHSHQGRTPPCTEAIIAAGIKAVAFGCIDPNPRVSGEGILRLRAAGVELIGPVLEGEAQALIADFALSVRERRPWVVVKAGGGRDGKVATRAGQAKWITSEAARARGRALRGEVGAVLAGIGTVLADDPALTVRDGRDEEPVRVVLDSRLRLPPSAQVVR